MGTPGGDSTGDADCNAHVAIARGCCGEAGRGRNMLTHMGEREKEREGKKDLNR